MSNKPITPKRAAELYVRATDAASKWEFMDGVLSMCNAHPDQSQREIIEQIGDEQSFIDMHGDHRDSGQAGRKASSRLKSISDEMSVVKTWAPADRVTGVSFEAHKVLNRLGSAEGRKILTALSSEAGGPGNVTKAMVTKRLKSLDPNHVPQSNGKTKPKPSAASLPQGNGQAGPLDLTTVSIDMLARVLASRLTVSDLGDAGVLSPVEAIVATYEKHAKRNAAKAKAKQPVPATGTPTSKAKRAAKPAVRTPSAPKRASKPQLKAKAAV